MAWRLEGTYFENCNCDMVCPCTTSALTMPADAERCPVIFVFHIDSGEIEGVDVSGLTVAVLVDAPQMMADGNWRVGMFMDEAASEEQAEKLGAVFSGQLESRYGGSSHRVRGRWPSAPGEDRGLGGDRDRRLRPSAAAGGRGL